MLYDRNGNPDPTVTPIERHQMAIEVVRERRAIMQEYGETNINVSQYNEAVAAANYWAAVCARRIDKDPVAYRAKWREASDTARFWRNLGREEVTA